MTEKLKDERVKKTKRQLNVDGVTDEEKKEN